MKLEGEREEGKKKVIERERSGETEGVIRKMERK